MKCRGPDPGPRGPNLEPQFRNLHFSKPPGRVPLWSPATDSRRLALSPWDGHTISQSGSVWSKSPFPLAPAPHSGRPWTQSSLPLGLCTSLRSRQSAVASSHVWHTVPQLCPQLWVLHAPGLPPQLCSPEPRPSPWDHLPSGPRWGARVCARRGAQGSGDVWHLHPARSSPPVPVSFPLLTSPHAYPFS